MSSYLAEFGVTGTLIGAVQFPRLAARLNYLDDPEYAGQYDQNPYH